MSALSLHLDALIMWMEKIGLSPPSREVRIVEIDPRAPVNERGRPRVRRGQLHKAASYAARFYELMKAGLPWINLSCYGCHEGFLVVAIETGENAFTAPGGPTSVNYSGPPALVLRHGWDVKEALAIED